MPQHRPARSLGSRLRVSGTSIGFLIVPLFLGSPAVLAAEDPFASNVRPTEALSPAEQRGTFHVPEGFAVQSVASEPDINKPMNLAFDAAGRLWVTTSREYPRAVPVGTEGRDRVMIFEDFGADGRARKVTTFATGLNIPIGVYPFRSASSVPAAERGARDGKPALPETTWKAVVWSIPNVWLMEDTDGDGRADRKEKLYGPFDHTRDTHGNQASFRRGHDGWLYATHGYNNDSHVAGRDGNRVDMNSGNTYRMRLDGSRIEHHTWGQVNPFGLAWDPEGNLYSSDCHSDPIYLLQLGGNYPSFGKPHDGLGFAPNMMEKIRGTTAIDGMTYYSDDLWPEEYRDSLFVGDVMMSRVFRDRAVLRGSARIARPEPDFLSCDDPWFRPVDMTLGPDGALYIADFYNRIIGHYEVPLDHPGRDRERGRIWRVVPTAKPLRAPALPADLDGLVTELGSPSLPRRMLAMNDLADRFGDAARGRLDAVIARPNNVSQQIHALWLRHRLGGLDAAVLQAAAASSQRLVRIHTQRILTDVLSGPGRGLGFPAERIGLARGLAVRGLEDPDAVVQRCAAEALSAYSHLDHVAPLLALLGRVPESDLHLRYGVRRALRNQLQSAEVLAAVVEHPPGGDASLPALLDVAVAVRSEGAARLILRNLDRMPGGGARATEALAHAARYSSAADLPTVLQAVRRVSAGNLDLEFEMFRSVRQGFAQRGAEWPADARAWGAELASRLVASATTGGLWWSRPIDAGSSGGVPWDFESRPCADGKAASLISSFPKGEALTGVLRSPGFRAPARLSFYLSGHDGPPDQAPGRKNKVRLVDASTGEVLKESAPPRQDTAQRVEWDLGALNGRSVAVEMVDGDTGSAYAWLAAGRWEPDVAPMPRPGPATRSARLIAAAEAAADSQAESLRTGLGALARSAEEDPAVRAAAARALTQDPAVRATAEVVADAALPWVWRQRLADVVFSGSNDGLDALLTAVWKDAPRRFQIRLATIAGVNEGLASGLIQRMASGTAPAGLLSDRRLRDRLRGAASDEARKVLDTVVASLPDEDATVASLLEERRRKYAEAKPNPARGREVFVAACAACHQIDGAGGLVGPQLTGIGSRGLERLCEDILAPNRNVDRAFWTTVLKMKDGESVTGLFRREEGALVVLANATGAEVSFPKSDIEARSETQVSLMPGNFGEAMSESDFHALMSFLLGGVK